MWDTRITRGFPLPEDFSVQPALSPDSWLVEKKTHPNFHMQQKNGKQFTTHYFFSVSDLRESSGK